MCLITLVCSARNAQVQISFRICVNIANRIYWDNYNNSTMWKCSSREHIPHETYHLVPGLQKLPDSVNDALIQSGKQWLWCWWFVARSPDWQVYDQFGGTDDFLFVKEVSSGRGAVILISNFSIATWLSRRRLRAFRQSSRRRTSRLQLRLAKTRWYSD